MKFKEEHILYIFICYFRWYSLRSKPGKEKNKLRGELEIRVAFIVKAGSLTDLSKKDKHKSSLGQLSHLAQSVGKQKFQISLSHLISNSSVFFRGKFT